MRFFSEDYLRELLAGWQQVQLVPVAVPHRKTGEPFKHVWRGTAQPLSHSDGPSAVFLSAGTIHRPGSGPPSKCPAGGAAERSLVGRCVRST